MTASNAAVVLLNPRHAHNVGNVVRACALLGADTLHWTGKRVGGPEKWPAGTRLPREERMKAYKRVTLHHYPEEDERVLETIRATHSRYAGHVPVCVEITDGAEDLRNFFHPEKAIYVFGPEDGGVPKGVRFYCHRFVRIPVWLPEHDPDARTPYNLAAAVNLVLYDRFVKTPVQGGALLRAPREMERF